MKCRTTDCDNDIKRSPYCANCRASFGYWDRKRPAQVLERRERLKLFTNRITFIIRDKGIKQ